MKTSATLRDNIFELSYESSAVRYADYLLAQAKQYEGKRSGKKTKLLLLASAAQLFDTVPPQDMRVSDICKGADASQGTFYLHFEAKTDIISELLSRFVDFEIRTMPLFTAEVHPFTNSLKMVHWYEASFRLNFGIMFYLVQLSDSNPEISRIWRKRSEYIVDRLMQWVTPAYGLSKTDEGYVKQICHSVGSMLDESLFARFGVHGAAQSGEQTDPNLVRELQALLIFRGLFAADPPAELLTAGKVYLPLIDLDKVKT